MAVTISAVMNEAARACSVAAPSSWLAANATLTQLQMRDFLNQTAREILDRVDLPEPFTVDYVITGNGSEGYELPSDFLRLTRDGNAVYETTSTRRNCIPVSTNGEWTYLKEIGSAGGDRYYRLTGDAAGQSGGFGRPSIDFYRPLEAGSSVTVSYVSANWVRNVNQDTTYNAWSVEGDLLMLPRDLVRLGVTWRFKRQKGLPYSDDMADYEIRLSRMINDARGHKVINFGGKREGGHPMRIPVPDYIER